MSKAELRRLGGLSGVLTMLESTKPSVQESAILVITNCTQDDDQFCLQLMQAPPEKLRLILSFLQCKLPMAARILVVRMCLNLFCVFGVSNAKRQMSLFKAMSPEPLQTRHLSILKCAKIIPSRML
jgi:hypothetical protein